ncbi:unnamed protein product, partial [marine sediment metagenome]
TIIFCISISGIILILYYLRRDIKVYKILREILECISKKAKEEIKNGNLDEWEKYYTLYNNKINKNKLIFDLRINLDKFKEDFINQIKQN